jgi:hypothetical protein
MILVLSHLSESAQFHGNLESFVNQTPYIYVGFNKLNPYKYILVLGV